MLSIAGQDPDAVSPVIRAAKERLRSVRMNSHVPLCELPQLVSSHSFTDKRVREQGKKRVCEKQSFYCSDVSILIPISLPINPRYQKHKSSSRILCTITPHLTAITAILATCFICQIIHVCNDNDHIPRAVSIGLPRLSFSGHPLMGAESEPLI